LVNIMTHIPHNYPLVVRDSGLATAISLMQRSLPYALMRFGIQLAYSVAAIVWLVVMIGGAAWTSLHIANVFGIVWFVIWAAGGGWIWATLLRYLLHLVECGHVAVLTELVTRGSVGNGNESMFEYGKRIVTERFGEVNALFAVNMLVRGVVNTVNGAIEGLTSFIPIPGLDSVARIISAITRAATRYIDKVIFSYNLARDDQNPWGGARDGLVYYAQNAKPILKQAVWIVILDYILGAMVWVVMLAPAVVVTMLLPQSVREFGAIVSIVIAVLFALAARGAFLKPLFLIMIMVRFHGLVEQQEINQKWVDWLDRLSDKFRELGNKVAQTFNPTTAPAQPKPAFADSSDNDWMRGR